MQEGQQGQGEDRSSHLRFYQAREHTVQLQRRVALTWAERDAHIQVQELTPPASPLPQNTEKTQKTSLHCALHQLSERPQVPSRSRTRCPSPPFLAYSGFYVGPFRVHSTLGRVSIRRGRPSLSAERGDRGWWGEGYQVLWQILTNKNSLCASSINTALGSRPTLGAATVPTSL